MGFFNSLFGNKEQQNKTSSLPWQELDSLDKIDEIEANSVFRPQIIFKHSTTCGISRMALNMFTNAYELEEGEADLHFLDLHRYRDVSNEISSNFQLVHQSPQVLIIKEGEVVAHASHGAIADIDLKGAI